MGLGRSPLTSDTEKLIRPVSRATLPQEIVKALTVRIHTNPSAPKTVSSAQT